MSKNDKINYLNIILILACVALSFLLPVELFLLSYAVLGPLHYLTEISWLRDKNYFLGPKSSQTSFYIVFLLLTIILLALGSASFIQLPLFNYLQQQHILLSIMIFLLIGSVILFQRMHYQFIFLILSLLSLLFIVPQKITFLIFGVYLFTLIHVYIFTGLFLLSGTLKQNNLSSWACFSLFLSIPFLYGLAYYFDFGTHLLFHLSAYANESYQSSFGELNKVSLVHIFGVLSFSLHKLFTHPASVILTRFIAFAYTYHYLNWFSKTSIIHWHVMSRPRMIMIGLFLSVAVLCYGYDYQLGFKILFLLSLSHVVLEFPLNYKTALEVAKNLKQWGKKVKK